VLCWRKEIRCLSAGCEAFGRPASLVRGYGLTFFVPHFGQNCASFGIVDPHDTQKTPRGFTVGEGAGEGRGWRLHRAKTAMTTTSTTRMTIINRLYSPSVSRNDGGFPSLIVRATVAS